MVTSVHRKRVAIGCSLCFTLGLPAHLVQKSKAGIVGIFSSNRNYETDALPTAITKRRNVHTTNFFFLHKPI